MPTELTWSIIVQHLGLSLIPFIIVILAGTGISYLLARLFNSCLVKVPGLKKFMVFVPWRAVAIFMAFAILSSSFLTRNFFLPSLVPGNSNGAILCVLFIPWITDVFLRSWHPRNLREKVFSTIRTISVLSFILPMFLQSAGMGYFIYMAAYWFETTKVNFGYWVLLLMTVVIDLIIGIIQFIFTHKKDK
jgi:hypothetical protein